MIRRPPRSTQSRSSAASDVYKRQEKYKLPIGIENMNKIHEEAEIAYLGVTVKELARVFNAIPSKYFGLTLDIAHASLLPGGPESFIDAFPKRIISTHVSDCLLYTSDAADDL